MTQPNGTTMLPSTTPRAIPTATALEPPVIPARPPATTGRTQPGHIGAARTAWRASSRIFIAGEESGWERIRQYGAIAAMAASGSAPVGRSKDLFSNDCCCSVWIAPGRWCFSRSPARCARRPCRCPPCPCPRPRACACAAKVAVGPGQDPEDHLRLQRSHGCAVCGCPD